MQHCQTSDETPTHAPAGLKHGAISTSRRGAAFTLSFALRLALQPGCTTCASCLLLVSNTGAYARHKACA